MERQNAIVETLVQKRVVLPYVEFLPAGYDSEQERVWPLVLFLHGAGERGSDLDLVVLHGPPKMASAGREFPFVLIAPQCPQAKWWMFQDDELTALLRHAIETYRVDTSRIYVTGLSMGGYETLLLATNHPRAFAAIAPICGGGDPVNAKLIAHIPTWAFHGDADETVPIKASQEMIDAMQEAGAVDARLTTYPGVGHDSWTQAYDTKELYDWMLSCTNPDFEL